MRLGSERDPFSPRYAETRARAAEERIAPWCKRPACIPTDQGARSDQRGSFGILGGDGWHHVQWAVAAEPQHYRCTSSPRGVLYPQARSSFARIESCRPEQPNRRIRDPYVRWSGRVLPARGGPIPMCAVDSTRPRYPNGLSAQHTTHGLVFWLFRAADAKDCVPPCACERTRTERCESAPGIRSPARN